MYMIWMTYPNLKCFVHAAPRRFNGELGIDFHPTVCYAMTHHTITYLFGLSVYILRDVCPIYISVTRRLAFVGHCKSHSLWGIRILETRHFQLIQFATNAAIVQQGLWPRINHVLVSPHQDAPGH